MQDLIKESGMSIKEFSEYYGIPYNTVREYYNGNRKAPEWVVKLMREKIEREKCGTQLSLFP